jgi:hypothetical protein
MQGGVESRKNISQQLQTLQKVDHHVNCVQSVAARHLTLVFDVDQGFVVFVAILYMLTLAA